MIRMTPAQREAMEAADKYGRANYFIKGRSAAGGYSATRAVLLRRGWINPHTEGLTDKGRAALEAVRTNG